MAQLEDMLQKMIRGFDASDEKNKDLRGDLANIRKKVDAHAIIIKHLELEMDQLSSTLIPRQQGTLPSNTIKNPQNDGQFMEITTRGGNQTMDPHMTSCVEDEVRK